ncbi:cysteine--tRNA ligase [Sphingomonas sp. ID0503]|uniref:cysteine--tRNA ligase n=1 Tax=Sphingomonas sp. ID0503 TaxID=3399691 RepID=UPI003AFB5ADE
MTTGAQITLFNSLGRALQPFTPIEPGHARVYSCGPTVYHYAHLGNLRAYVFTDTLRRVLDWKGYRVTHVINITDVGHLTSDADAGEDKMEKAAAGTGKDIWEVAAFYTDAFKTDLRQLNILDPSRWSIATDHIDDMLDFAKAIEANGAAYPLDTGLYFDVTKVPDYGALAGAPPQDDGGVARIAEVEGKRHPADFALWRNSPLGETRQMEWDSPWGRGAPGWHLECSVMSIKYLGAQFDIHTGGIDHREIHHPNEIAQNQAFTCTSATGANYWLHNNFLVDRGGKMSKSKGDISTLQSLIDRGVHPLAYRLLCLSAHYRSELEFSAEAVSGALTRLRRLAIAVQALVDRHGETHFPLDRERLEGDLPKAATDLLTQFDAAVSADLMTPQALPLLDQAIASKALSLEEKLRVIASMDRVLGLGILDLRRADLRVRPVDALITEAEIDARLAERKEARAAKDFARSDAIRDELAAQGVEVMDGDPLGWDWRVTL